MSNEWIWAVNKSFCPKGSFHVKQIQIIQIKLMYYMKPIEMGHFPFKFYLYTVLTGRETEIQIVIDKNWWFPNTCNSQRQAPVEVEDSIQLSHNYLSHHNCPSGFAFSTKLECRAGTRSQIQGAPTWNMRAKTTKLRQCLGASDFALWNPSRKLIWHKDQMKQVFAF